MSWLRSLKDSASKLQTHLSWLAGAPTQRKATYSGKYAFPENLVIYQESNKRVAFVVLTNFFALSPFAFSIYHYVWPQWHQGNKTAAIFSPIFLLPVPFTAISTRSFVYSIFLKLPPAARVSTAALNNWLKRIPRTTKVSFQQPGGLLGVPVTSAHPIMNICPLPPRWGRIANFSTFAARNRLFAYGQHFYVGTGMEGGSDKVLARNVWPKVAAIIKNPPKWN